MHLNRLHSSSLSFLWCSLIRVSTISVCSGLSAPPYLASWARISFFLLWSYSSIAQLSAERLRCKTHCINSLLFPLLSPHLVRHKAIILKGFLSFPCSHSCIRLARYEAVFSFQILGFILFLFLSSLLSVKRKIDKNVALKTNKKHHSFELTKFNGQ